MSSYIMHHRLYRPSHGTTDPTEHANKYLQSESATTPVQHVAVPPDPELPFLEFTIPASDGRAQERIIISETMILVL